MPASRPGHLRALAANLTLASFSVLAIFGMAEGLLRVTGLAPSRALRSPDLATLDSIPGIYAPGQEFTDRVRRDLPSRIRIGNLGFRGRDLGEVKAPGTLRVMVLGDSYTFGDHVNTEESWPAQLESLLLERIARLPEPRPPGRGAQVKFEVEMGAGGPPPRRARAVEVINAGANGFGILDMEILWEKAGDRLAPEIVILTFSPNDISDLGRPVPMIRQMRANAGLKSRPVIGSVLRLLQNTALFNGMQILRARMKGSRAGAGGAPGMEPARAGPVAAPEAWEAYREALLRLAGTISGSGRRVLLVLYPSHPHVQGDELFHAGEVVPGWASEAGIPVLSLLPALEAAALRGERLYLVPRDGHPAPAGHAVAALAVAGEIERLGWLHGGTVP